MRAMPEDEMERTPLSPREEMERKLAAIEAKAKMLAQRHGRLAVGIAVTAAAAFGLGMLVYRRTSQKSMMGRARRAIPDSVWDMPEELVAHLKKPLQRAAKVL